MRSGNGRHRRPRQAPAFFVAAGVTGAGIAIPLLGAGSAQAADAATWDRVAECESGGLWSSNGGNGYYGGLQLTQDTWEQYGGTDFAERPDLASRGQQIAVAEKILADQGPRAWPSCAVQGGLTEGATESPDTDPEPSDDPTYEPPSSSEPTPTPTPTPGTSTGPGGEPTQPSEPSTEPTRPGEPSDGPTPTPTPTPSTPESGEPGTESPSPTPTSPSPSAPEPEEPGTDSPSPTPTSPSTGYPGHPGEPDGSDGSDGSGDSEQPGDGEGTGRHRGEPDEREGRGPGHPSRGGHDKGGQDGDYRVQRGDSLSAIAAEHDVEGGWPALYEDNREAVGSDPDLIIPGQRLRL
ncbi:LysM peptidoglycan-binding domain-containing protein [Streptomyces armeniacus]|uniref:LysM peptidoglycan-binding domain-containing protein n=1 Tax=Streptomyces armeniacus TaxID=83291 RepID=A0A345XUI3_9ACTN|nr:transglycosylase family protein [Streptomyces armeniacus]AXK35299.1 LysM peptidoglycan-binding domain-containing protein [Streptomyces armeniacus]